ncbi:MAG TPA: hypothetical protein VIY27_02310 [Myxococcota bacterium]
MAEVRYGEVERSGQVQLRQASSEATSVARIQLILAEKRTSLAVMRTGIGVFTLPLSVVTVLIATSRHYDFLEAYHLLVPLLILCAGLVVLAIYLIHRSVLRIWRQDAMIRKIKREDPGLAEFYRGYL